MYEIDIGTMSFDILQESYGQDKGTDSEQGQQGNGKYFIAYSGKLTIIADSVTIMMYSIFL